MDSRGQFWASFCGCHSNNSHHAPVLGQLQPKVMTLHVSKGLKFLVVVLVGAGRMPAEGEDERKEARLFYAEATRATQRV